MICPHCLKRITKEDREKLILSLVSDKWQTTRKIGNLAGDVNPSVITKPILKKLEEKGRVEHTILERWNLWRLSDGA
jgi:hypothetical protein